MSATASREAGRLRERCPDTIANASFPLLSGVNTTFIPLLTAYVCVPCLSGVKHSLIRTLKVELRHWQLQRNIEISSADSTASRTGFIVQHGTGRVSVSHRSCSIRL